MGYSDVLNLHLFCRRAGLSTFYGPNLLSPLADPQGLHPDTVRWFRRTLMEGAAGPVEVPGSWTLAARPFTRIRRMSAPMRPAPVTN